MVPRSMHILVIDWIEFDNEKSFWAKVYITVFYPYGINHIYIIFLIFILNFLFIFYFSFIYFLFFNIFFIKI